MGNFAISRIAVSVSSEEKPYLLFSCYIDFQKNVCGYIFLRLLLQSVQPDAGINRMYKNCFADHPGVLCFAGDDRSYATGYLPEVRLFCKISCTLFSPKSLAPASWASSSIGTGLVLLTAISVTSFGSRPAPAGFAYIFSYFTDLFFLS